MTKNSSVFNLSSKRAPKIVWDNTPHNELWHLHWKMIDWAARERGCLRDRSLKQSSCKSPIIWWMVYLPNRWGETCIKIKRVVLDVSWSRNRLEIWIICLCSLSGSKLEMNLSCEWFSTANNAARLIHHLRLSRSGSRNGFYRLWGFTPAWIFHLHKSPKHWPPRVLKDHEKVWIFTMKTLVF